MVSSILLLISFIASFYAIVLAISALIIVIFEFRAIVEVDNMLKNSRVSFLISIILYVAGVLIC